jgi:plasmid stability protein
MNHRALSAEFRNLVRLLGEAIPRSKAAAANQLANIAAAEKRIAAMTRPQHSRKPPRGWWRWS